jgi:(2Fe-2S) ferredoxin
MIQRFKQLIGKSSQQGAAPSPSPDPKMERHFCDAQSPKPCVTVCIPPKGCQCDCDQVRQALTRELKKHDPSIVMGNAKTGCSGKCENGPFIGFPQREFFYLNVHPEDVPDIVSETLMKGRLLFPLLSVSPNRSYRSDIYYEKHTGLLAAIHDRVCMVNVAKYFLDFEQDLSCGKCVPCRLGMKRVQEDMELIVSGQGAMENLEQVRILCETMTQTSHCEFAMTSVRPILSAIRYFEDEFRVHIEKRECPTGECEKLVALQLERAKKARRAKRR